MKEIFFIRANTSRHGGAEVYLSRLSNALMQKKIKHRIVNSIFPKFIPSWLRAILFNFQVCLSKKRNVLYFSLDRISCPDIYRAGDGVHRVFLQTEKKSWLNPLHPVYLHLEKKCFENAKAIITNSHLIKTQIIDTYAIPTEKIHVVYNGIEIIDYSYPQAYANLADEFPILADDTIVLYVGSGFKRKGVAEFLQIVSKLDRPTIKAFVVGKDKHINYYKNLAHQLGISSRVFFTGPRNDVYDFYAISDIFILPTHYEPFSNVILEAMSFGSVVFTTKQNGAHEILTSKFIMETPDDFEIVHTINALLSDSTEMEKIKRDNRYTAENFSIEKNMEETLSVLNRVNNVD